MKSSVRREDGRVRSRERRRLEARGGASQRGGAAQTPHFSNSNKSSSNIWPQVSRHKPRLAPRPATDCSSHVPPQSHARDQQDAATSADESIRYLATLLPTDTLPVHLTTLYQEKFQVHLAKLLHADDVPKFMATLFLEEAEPSYLATLQEAEPTPSHLATLQHANDVSRYLSTLFQEEVDPSYLATLQQAEAVPLYLATTRQAEAFHKHVATLQQSVPLPSFAESFCQTGIYKHLSESGFGYCESTDTLMESSLQMCVTEDENDAALAETHFAGSPNAPASHNPEPELELDFGTLDCKQVFSISSALTENMNASDLEEDFDDHQNLSSNEASHLEDPAVSIQSDLSSSEKTETSSQTPLVSYLFGFNEPKFILPNNVHNQVSQEEESESTTSDLHPEMSLSPSKDVPYEGDSNSAHNVSPEYLRPPDPLLSWTCNVCLQIFRSSSDLLQHKREVHSLSKKSCHLCDKKYASSNSVKRHLASMHGSELHCRNCRKICHSLAHLKMHCEICPRGKQICNICFKELCSPDGLTKHKLRVHAKESTICKKCSKVFVSKEHLQMHQAICGKQKSSCDLCNEVFTNSRKLKQHKASCEKQKLSCDLCKELFANSRELKQHKAIYHESQKFSPALNHVEQKKKKAYLGKKSLKKKIIT